MDFDDGIDYDEYDDGIDRYDFPENTLMGEDYFDSDEEFSCCADISKQPNFENYRLIEKAAYDEWFDNELIKEADEAMQNDGFCCAASANGVYFVDNGYDYYELTKADIQYDSSGRPCFTTSDGTLATIKADGLL